MRTGKDHTIYSDEETWEEARRIANIRGVSISELFRMMVAKEKRKTNQGVDHAIRD